MFFYQINYVQTSTSQCFWRFIFKVESLHSSRYFQERSCDHFHDAIYGFNLSRYMLNINNGDLNMLRTFKLKFWCVKILLSNNFDQSVEIRSKNSKPCVMLKTYTYADRISLKWNSERAKESPCNQALCVQVITLKFFGF